MFSLLSVIMIMISHSEASSYIKFIIGRIFTALVVILIAEILICNQMYLPIKYRLFECAGGATDCVTDKRKYLADRSGHAATFAY